jgi:hypothetical protein
MSPVQQISKGQRLTAQLTIQPDTEIVQSCLGRQSSLESSQLMGPFSIQSKSMMQLLTYRLYNLPQARHPATQPLRPGLATIALRRTHYPSLIMAVPVPVPFFPFKKSSAGFTLALATMNRGSPPQMKMEPGRGTLSLVSSVQKVD